MVNLFSSFSCSPLKIYMYIFYFILFFYFENFPSVGDVSLGFQIHLSTHLHQLRSSFLFRLSPSTSYTKGVFHFYLWQTIEKARRLQFGVLGGEELKTAGTVAIVTVPSFPVTTSCNFASSFPHLLYYSKRKKLIFVPVPTLTGYFS